MVDVCCSASASPAPPLCTVHYNRKETACEGDSPPEHHPRRLPTFLLPSGSPAPFPHIPPPPTPPTGRLFYLESLLISSSLSLHHSQQCLLHSTSSATPSTISCWIKDDSLRHRHLSLHHHLVRHWRVFKPSPHTTCFSLPSSFRYPLKSSLVTRPTSMSVQDSLVHVALEERHPVQTQSKSLSGKVSYFTSDLAC